MLSILIPTYNCACVQLAEELSRQAATLGATVEIVVVDDASTDASVVKENCRINDIENCRFVRLEKNIGIAKMRNRILQEAKYQWILCLDADVFPAHADFLRLYAEEIGKADVVCGGLAYRTDGPTRVNALRYKYGVSHEVRPLAERQANPYQSFKTSNYLINSKISKAIAFDESFAQYGHEDTLFGKMLQQSGVAIKHIQNPVYHDDNDTAEQFLTKTRKGIDNLLSHSDQLSGYSRLLRTYKKLKRLCLASLISFIFRKLRHRIERNLLSDNPSMRYFGFYKIGYMCTIG
ncbi:MAG: glycosyltransferase family 2 protein [Bacteroidales bacterium]|nr:glycosyltransferase family 2 protein [Bacteroidales bacterium]